MQILHAIIIDVALQDYRLLMLSESKNMLRSITVSEAQGRGLVT